jgi:hypothetical protein
LEGSEAQAQHLATHGSGTAVGGPRLRTLGRRRVFGAWEELPDVWRDVFTVNGPALLAEVRGGETTDTARLAELSMPTLVVTAEDSPEPIRRGSEALEGALPQARQAHVGGGHAIDPAGPDVREFIWEFVQN